MKFRNVKFINKIIILKIKNTKNLFLNLDLNAKYNTQLIIKINKGIKKKAILGCCLKPPKIDIKINPKIDVIKIID